MTDEIIIGGDSVDIPAGTYGAKLFAFGTKHSTKFDNDFRVWDFQLANGTIVGASSSLNTGKKSKGGKWIAALLGRVPDKGETLSASDLIGRPCLVVVKENDEGWPEVENVLPPMAATSPVASAVPAGTVSPAVPAVKISEDLPF